MADKYDLVVIGSGPAGEKGAAQAAYFGKRVALVEKERALGGACANTGTLPSKTLRESALFLSGLHQREIYGLRRSARNDEMSVQDFMVHKEFVVHKEHERIASNIARHKIELLQGRATLTGEHTVRVTAADGGTRDLTAEAILVATGSSPHRPPEIPFDDPDIDDSDEILALDSMPGSLIVVGGGVIGSEYASVFAALGTTKVTLIEGRNRLLGFLDQEIGDVLTHAFREQLKMEVILEDTVARYEKPAPRHVRLTLKSGRVLDADRLLVAAGRAGNTRNLGLETVGVKVDDRGRILVNEHFQTNLPHVYAAGDVIGWPSLAATSMDQGRVAMCHAFGFTYKTHMAKLFPYGLYTIPEVSTVGDSEEDAKKKGIDYEVGRAYYRDNARGQIINDPTGMLKLIFEATTRKLLGVHILGERATELVHVGQAVMGYGGTIDFFIESVFNYPTLSEIYKYAAYDGLGRLAQRRHQPKAGST